MTQELIDSVRTMDPIFEQFLKNFREKNLDGCRQLINQPEFDINYIFTQAELSMRLPNFPVTSKSGTYPIGSSSSGTSTLNVLHLIARLGKKWSSSLITSILDRGVGVVGVAVDIDLPNKDGWTALMMAACDSDNTSCLETVETLIRAGANLDIQEETGYSALMMAAGDVTDSSLEAVKTLIRGGAKLDLQCKKGWTALMEASQYSTYKSSLEVVETLIRAGATINLQDNDGYTALMAASENAKTTSSLETVKTLILAGANLDLQTTAGWTALMLASCSSNDTSSLETVKTLILAGANLDLQDDEGFTALDMAPDDLKTYIEILIKKARLNNECSQIQAKLVQELEQSYERMQIQFESEVVEIKTQAIFCNISRIDKDKIEGLGVCDICLERQNNVMSCSQDGCGVVCGPCLTWYLEADPKLVPVSLRKVPGVYCLISPNHVFSLSHLMRSLMLMTESTEPNNHEHLEELELSLQARYFSEQSKMVQTIAKAEALESFKIHGQIATMVRTIEDTILCDVCPNCHQLFINDGCEAVSCTCGFNFCNVCLVFKTRGDVHSHVLECIQKNSLKSTDDYFLCLKERIDWRNKQRCGKLRKFLESNCKGDLIPILVSLFDKHEDLQPFLLSEFPEYKK